MIVEQPDDSASAPGKNIRITIFHTNDMHCRLEAMTRLSHLARRLRDRARAEGRVVFFWDAGDAADRRERIVSATKGAAFAPVLNAMGYGLQTMGNDLPLPYGPQAMKAIAARSQFPILAANCRDGSGPLPEGLLESVVIELTPDLRMGVFGLTAQFSEIYAAFGLRQPDFLESAARMVSKLRQEGASLVVLLSHLGSREDRQIAAGVSGIDLIIGGHSHERFEHGEEVNGVLIAQAGEYAQALGCVEVTLDAGSGRVIERCARLIDLPGEERPDPRVVSAIESARREVEDLLAQPAGELQGPLDLNYFGECGIGSFAADVLRERMGADAALLAAGQFQRELPGGVITLGQLDEACFSSANPAWTEVTGAEILAAIERGLDPAVQRQEIRGFRGAPLGMIQSSGLVVEYNPQAPAGQKVRSVLIQGQRLDPRQRYRLAHTDAETYSEGYLRIEDPTRIHYEMPVILPETIRDYLRSHSPVPVPAKGRWIENDSIDTARKDQEPV